MVEEQHRKPKRGRSKSIPMGGSVVGRLTCWLWVGKNKVRIEGDIPLYLII